MCVCACARTRPFTPTPPRHLAAVEIMQLKNIVILQNKIGACGCGERERGEGERVRARARPHSLLPPLPPAPSPNPDLVKEEVARSQYQQIRAFVAGTVA